MKEIMAFRDLVARELQVAIKRQVKASDPAIGWGQDFFDRLAPYAVGGKLLRGCLVCFAHRTFTDRAPDKSVLKAAAAVELAHSCLLIHDDIMDRDALRRGRPSMHNQYEALGAARHVANSERLGASLAICGGDATMLLAFRLLSEAQALGHSDGLGQLFSDQLLRVCAGQMQDVYFDATPELPTKSDILRLMRAKTAAYTMALPLALGAALAKQNPSTLRHLQRFGEAAGTIYQIRDDELGLIGDQSVIGKPAGSDIRQHKKTLIHYYLLKRTRAGDRRRLEALFTNKAEIDYNDITTVRSMIMQYRIGDDLAKDIETLSRQAIKSLDQLALPDSARHELTELLDFCVQRSS